MLPTGRNQLVAKGEDKSSLSDYLPKSPIFLLSRRVENGYKEER